MNQHRLVKETRYASGLIQIEKRQKKRKNLPSMDGSLELLEPSIGLHANGVVRVVVERV